MGLDLQQCALELLGPKERSLRKAYRGRGHFPLMVPPATFQGFFLEKNRFLHCKIALHWQDLLQDAAKVLSGKTDTTPEKRSSLWCQKLGYPVFRVALNASCSFGRGRVFFFCSGTAVLEFSLQGDPSGSWFWLLCKMAVKASLFNQAFNCIHLFYCCC